ncbi:hypothetical protein JCM11491_005921 [Sporobolomyces phaffii]
MSDTSTAAGDTRPTARSESPVRVVVLSESRPFPRTLAERARFLRQPKDGAKPRKVTPFQWKLYDLLLKVPPGKVSTYGQLSSILSSSPRAVGSALRDNPFAPFVPCHRIVATTGYIGGYCGEWTKPTPTSKKAASTQGRAQTARAAATAVQGPKVTEKFALLRSEGVKFDDKGMLKDKTCWWQGV